jgi:hypothetical protein
LSAKKNLKKLKKEFDGGKNNLILYRMNLINSLPSNATADYASLSDTDRAELHAWFAMVDAINDEADLAWDRLASLVDSGVL